MRPEFHNSYDYRRGQDPNIGPRLLSAISFFAIKSGKKVGGAIRKSSQLIYDSAIIRMSLGRARRWGGRIYG